MSGRTTGALVKRFVGDAALARQYIGQARALHGRMLDYLRGRAGSKRWVLQDGTVITTDASPAGSLVRIDVRSTRPEPREPEFEYARGLVVRPSSTETDGISRHSEVVWDRYTSKWQFYDRASNLGAIAGAKYYGRRAYAPALRHGDRYWSDHNGQVLSWFGGINAFVGTQVGQTPDQTQFLNENFVGRPPRPRFLQALRQGAGPLSLFYRGLGVQFGTDLLTTLAGNLISGAALVQFADSTTKKIGLVLTALKGVRQADYGLVDFTERAFVMGIEMRNGVPVTFGARQIASAVWRSLARPADASAVMYSQGTVAIGNGQFFMRKDGRAGVATRVVDGALTEVHLVLSAGNGRDQITATLTAGAPAGSYDYLESVSGRSAQNGRTASFSIALPYYAATMQIERLQIDGVATIPAEFGYIKNVDVLATEAPELAGPDDGPPNQFEYTESVQRTINYAMGGLSGSASFVSTFHIEATLRAKHSRDGADHTIDVMERFSSKHTTRTGADYLMLYETNPVLRKIGAERLEYRYDESREHDSGAPTIQIIDNGANRFYTGAQYDDVIRVTSTNLHSKVQVNDSAAERQKDFLPVTRSGPVLRPPRGGVLDSAAPTDVIYFFNYTDGQPGWPPPPATFAGRSASGNLRPDVFYALINGQQLPNQGAGEPPDPQMGFPGYPGVYNIYATYADFGLRFMCGLHYILRKLPGGGLIRQIEETEARYSQMGTDHESNQALFRTCLYGIPEDDESQIDNDYLVVDTLGVQQSIAFPGANFSFVELGLV